MNISKTRELLRTGKTIYDLPLRVAYYARVSTDKDDQLNSLANQKKYFEELINDNHAWQFSGSYLDEGISGTAVNHRPAFLKMIEDATFGKLDLILTKEISRFSRNTVDSIKYTEYLLKHGVIVYFLSDNLNTIQEDAEFRLTIMSSLAQDEVRKLSERVKFGISRMIKERKLIGGNLTGYYKKNGRLEINPNEASLIKYLYETYTSGNISLQTISKNLAKKGYLNTKGKPYSQTTLAKFLTNPRYKGYYTARLTEVKNYKTHKKHRLPEEEHIIEKDPRIPSIVSEELWNLANEIYHKRKQINPHILNSEKNITTSKYSCLIICQDCHNIFIRAGGGNRTKNPTWICQTYKHHGVMSCKSPIIPESLLDNLFINILSNIISTKKDYQSTILKDYESILKTYQPVNNLTNIKAKLNKTNNQLSKLLDLSLKGLITDNEFKLKHGNLIQELNNLKQELSNQKSQQSSPNQTNTLTNINTFLSEKFNIKTSLSTLIKLFINKITIEKINHNRYHLKLTIYFNYQHPPLIHELILPTRKKSLINN